MGTPRAVNFANLFMSKFESDMLNDYEAQYGCRPAYWARFNDDLFFIWTGDEESLKVFLNFCNNYSKSQNRKTVFQVNSGIPHLFCPLQETKTSRTYWSDLLSHNHQTNQPQPWVNLTIALVLFVLQWVPQIRSSIGSWDVHASVKKGIVLHHT